MIIHSDWHIHSEASYDAALTLNEIAKETSAFGFKKFGITDHVNYNDYSYLSDLEKSAKLVNEFKRTNPNIVLGVEFTPIAKPEFDYIERNGTRDGYAAPFSATPYDIELGRTKEQLIAMGVQYAIGAFHWRVDAPNAKMLPADLDDVIKECFRQQLWMACDERVTVLGHPWYSGTNLWNDDFSVIPHSMNLEIAAALKENRKYIECNSFFFNSPKTSEKFRCQYAEFLREMHEMGLPVTYGSDAHNTYIARHTEPERYLAAAGFKDGDIVEIKEESLW